MSVKRLPIALNAQIGDRLKRQVGLKLKVRVQPGSQPKAGSSYLPIIIPQNQS